MLHARPTALLLACIGSFTLVTAVVHGQDGGIIEGMAIEEIAEEGVKAAVIAGVLSGAEAEQLGEAAELIYDSPDDRVQEPGEVDREFIEMLGASLKSEVEQGRMNESDAWSIYLGSVADVRTWYREQDEAGRTVTVPWSRRPAQSGGLATMQLFGSGIKGDHTLEHITRPDYLRRDARHLAAELRLDADTAGIYELLITDYLDAFERAIERFYDRMNRGQRGGAVQTLDASLARVAQVDLANLDWAGVERRNPWMKRNAGARQWIEDSIGTFQGVIGGIREDLARQRADLLEDGTGYTLSESIEALRQLRRTRDSMKDELEAQMQAFVPEGQQVLFAEVLADLEIDRVLSAVTLSGVRFDFESALREAQGIRPFDALSGEQVVLLQDSTDRTLEPARQWMQALIDAELAGYVLNLKIKYAPTDSDPALGQYGRALREATDRELVLRDTVLALFQSIVNSIGEHDPDLASGFQLAGWRQGFPVQMRPRWSERALQATLAFEDLDPELRESILEFEAGTLSQLPLIRQQAIQKCQTIEARVARGRIQLLFDGLENSSMELMPMVREPEHRRFMELDDRTADLLEAILTEEQFARLPRRPGTRLAEWDRKESGAGKGGGKSKADGKGRGTGKAEGKGGGKGGGKGSGKGGKG